jgi:hypothetical protein
MRDKPSGDTEAHCPGGFVRKPTAIVGIRRSGRAFREIGATNRLSGLAVICPLTSKRKPYLFALPITLDQGRRGLLRGRVEVVIRHVTALAV